MICMRHNYVCLCDMRCCIVRARYLHEADQSIFVCVMVETAEAVENIDAICAVPGLDSVCIGQNDLSGSLGQPYLMSWKELEAPGGGMVKAAVDRVCSACLQAGVAVGVRTGDQEMALEVMSRVNCRGWISTTTDLPAIVTTIDRQLTSLHSALAKL